MITQEQQEKFKELSIPLIDFLNQELNPHFTIIITINDAELLEGITSFVKEDLPQTE